MDRQTLAIVLGIGGFSIFFVACVLAVVIINPFTSRGPTAGDIPSSPVAEVGDNVGDSVTAPDLPEAPTEMPTDVVPTDVPPTDVPPTDVPPTDVPQSDDTPTEPAEENTEETQDNPPVATGTGDGTACVALNTVLETPPMMCLDANGAWTVYTTGNSPLGNNPISAFEECLDGAIWASGGGRLARFDGQAWQEIEQATDDFRNFMDLACTDEGGFWGLHSDGVDYFDGETWTTYTIEDIAPDQQETFPKAIAVAPDGLGWLALSETIHSFDGQTWTQYSDGAGWNGRLFFEDIAIDQAGQPWAMMSDELLSFDGSSWQLHEPTGFRSFFNFSSFAIDSQDRKWIASEQGALRFDGQEWDLLNRENSDISSNSVDSITFDSADRAWITTEWGLNVFDGTQWASYHMDTSELVNNDLKQVAVIGAGPALPDLITKPTGSVTGVLRAEGSPLADAQVEICVEGLNQFGFTGVTPCSGQPAFYQTTTDAEGRFRFDEVPTGHYAIAIGVSDGWTFLSGMFGSSSRMFVEPEQEVDLGEIVIDPA